MRSKKAIFQPMLILFIFIVLCSLAVMISVKNSELNAAEEHIGFSSLAVFRAYEEAENERYFLNKALTYSTYEALSILGKNGGYPEINTCTKYPGSDFLLKDVVIFNTCGELNLQMNLLTAANEIFTYRYKPHYRSTILRDEMFFAEYPIPGGISLEYSNLFQNIRLIEATAKANSITYKINPIILPIQNQTIDTYYETNVSVTVPKPDLKPLAAFFTTLKTCDNLNLADCQKIINALDTDPLYGGVYAIEKEGYLYIKATFWYSPVYKTSKAQESNEVTLKLLIDFNTKLPDVKLDYLSDKEYVFNI